MEKYDGARYAADDNGILLRKRFACSVRKATNTRSLNIKYLLLSVANVVKRTRLNITLKVRF